MRQKVGQRLKRRIVSSASGRDGIEWTVRCSRGARGQGI